LSGIRQLCALIFAITVTAALPACAVYRKCGLSGCPGDARITAEVRALLDQHAALGPPNLIRVQTLDRVVYLSGQVSTDLQREIAQSIALEAPGVARVVNSLAEPYGGR
jgi:osmotically-inducible protein OsmY